MKKSVIAVAVVGLMSFSAAEAAPLAHSWYSGASLGWSNYQNSNFSGSYSDISSEQRNTTAGSLFGGYQFNHWFALEGGYEYLGKLKYTHDGHGDSFRTQGVALAGKFSYSLLRNIDVYGKVGTLIYRSNSEESMRSGLSPLLAVGGEYAFNNKLSTTLEYQWVSHLGDQDQLGANPNNGLLSLGVVYHY